VELAAVLGKQIFEVRKKNAGPMLDGGIPMGDHTGW
jgi:hypothetical protein